MSVVTDAKQLKCERGLRGSKKWSQFTQNLIFLAGKKLCQKHRFRRVLRTTENELQSNIAASMQQAELFNDKSNTHEFVNLVKELALPGELTQSRSYDFEFMQVEKPYESYIGSNVRLRYFLKVTIVRRLSDLIKEYDLIVHQLATYPDVNNSIKMEVGIEDCLHIEFEYNKSKIFNFCIMLSKTCICNGRVPRLHLHTGALDLCPDACRSYNLGADYRTLQLLICLGYPLITTQREVPAIYHFWLTAAAVTTAFRHWIQPRAAPGFYFRLWQEQVLPPRIGIGSYSVQASSSVQGCSTPGSNDGFLG
ncbi:unnamed protein product [Ranitomeya imitator]|uniref:Uncharacterized protein n=1 Tax=Ranitomeya imitator TaxID=111125 RepID=A0ABN9MF80_9NEOB|nr:unnamed protein product [Ranitomeya imitator]